MGYDHVIYEKKGHIAYVTLNRPERMNALDNHSHGELIEIFDDFAADANAWLAIITGAGDRAFCAGNDLKATAEASANKGGAGASRPLEPSYPPDASGARTPRRTTSLVRTAGSGRGRAVGRPRWSL